MLKQIIYVSASALMLFEVVANSASANVTVSVGNNGVGAYVDTYTYVAPPPPPPPAVVVMPPPPPPRWSHGYMPPPPPPRWSHGHMPPPHHGGHYGPGPRHGGPGPHGGPSHRR